MTCNNTYINLLRLLLFGRFRLAILFLLVHFSLSMEKYLGDCGGLEVVLGGHKKSKHFVFHPPPPIQKHTHTSLLRASYKGMLKIGMKLTRTTLIIPISVCCYYELPSVITSYSRVQIFTAKSSIGCWTIENINDFVY